MTDLCNHVIVDQQLRNRLVVETGKFPVNCFARDSAAGLVARQLGQTELGASGKLRGRTCLRVQSPCA
jgi:hypothetical protein